MGGHRSQISIKMRIFKLVGLLIASTLFISCAANIPISFLCNEQHVEIYVDEEYIGQGLVNYIVPKGTDYIKVSCRENGIEIYNRNYYVKGKKNQLFELNIPKDYRYSSGQQVKSQVK